jgi:hypothetical protein
VDAPINIGGRRKSFTLLPPPPLQERTREKGTEMDPAQMKEWIILYRPKGLSMLYVTTVVAEGKQDAIDEFVAERGAEVTPLGIARATYFKSTNLGFALDAIEEQTTPSYRPTNGTLKEVS